MISSILNKIGGKTLIVTILIFSGICYFMYSQLSEAWAQNARYEQAVGTYNQVLRDTNKENQNLRRELEITSELLAKNRAEKQKIREDLDMAQGKVEELENHVPKDSAKCLDTNHGDAVNDLMRRYSVH